MKFSLAGLLAVLVALVASLAILLFTEAGGRWLLDKVPGMQVDDFQGTLGGRWSATRLTWQQDGTTLKLEAPLLEWSPACLMRRTLCIKELASDSIYLDLPPSPPDAAVSPLSLPELRLPLALEIGQVRIGRFLLDGNDQFQQLELVAHWQTDGLRLDRLSLRRDELALDLQGSLLPEGGWPLTLEGNLQLPAPGEGPWSLALKAQGDLQGVLKVQADSKGYLNGRLEGDVRPLAENLPANARLWADGFKATAELPDTLTLNQVDLTAGGDLKQGFAVRGKASLPGQGGPVALELRGRVDTKGADIEQLLLTGDPKQSLAVQGRVDWQKQLAVDSRLQWRDFPWQRLFPQEQPPPVELQRMDAELRYGDSRYEGKFDARLKGPAGEFSLASPVAGDMASVTLADLRLTAGQGRAQGRVKIDFADGVGWDGQLALSQLDPSFWLAELPGTLAGRLESKGTWREQRLELNANLDLNGRLRGQPAVLQGRVAGAGELWSVNGLQLRLGDNRVSGQAQLDRRLSGRLDLALNQLGQLWPGLFGQAQGRLDLAGSLQNPQGNLTLSGQRLGQGDRRIERLSLDARLDAGQRGRLQLSAEGLASGDSKLGNLKVEGSGDRQRQQLQLDLEGPPLDLLLAFDGRLDRGNWRGRLARGELKAIGQDWRLDAPARLERLANGRLELGAHCWRYASASLCGGEQRLMPDPRLDMRLRDFPLESLARWLPDDLVWKGELNGDLRLDLPASGPNGRITLDAGSGVVRVKKEDAEEWVDFPYQRLLLDSTLRPQSIDTQLSYRSEGLGSLQVDARIDPRPARKPLSGQFRLDGLDLAVLRPFVPMVDQFEGRLQGSGTLGGNLMAPYVLGNLRLSDGHISGGELPVSFEDLNLDARIAGESLVLNGQWRSGNRGQGTISGHLDWSGATDLDMRVTGRRLPLVVEPFANMEMEPDLRLGLAGENLSVTGRVAVPRGRIVIRQLPPQAVRVSPDARIIGEQETEQRRLNLSMDVAVEVGQDRLQFSGFGLTADVRGHLRVGDNLTTRGELVLRNGRFNAYGQRLELRRARLLFAGALEQPFIDVEAIRTVGVVTAGLRLSGPADEPTTEVFSNPAMGQEQALSYLILGRLNSGGDRNALGQAALSLGLAGGAPITRELGQRLGLQDLQLDSDGATGEVNDRLSIRYGLGMVDSTSLVAVRYRLTRRLYLEAASGLASSLDLFYQRDF
ncbi:translocation/assembly module TamB domain-containing protein [Metapseudomonas resinovorans]|uniref:Translocation and assembly module TamB C-terminal domain-containing protein n=1 Tax=Metapseudomonas resinovorans NBRC 106553 TaxID=1245471 RepID=S6AWL2_METRE|nr:hypothetical protein PCA10_32290 [Pseudomonas resinovorans NBRC 106553]